MSVKTMDLPRPRSELALRLRAWLRNPSLLAGSVMLAIVFLVAIFAPLIAPHSPTEQDLRATLKPPSLEHPMGTDDLGRDILSRVIYGTRVDLQIGIICVVFPLIFGTVVGLLAGYYGGIIDTVSMRLVDVVVAFPFLVLIIAIVAALGPGLTNMYIAVSLVGWIAYARIIRGEVLVAKNLEYVLASKALGYSDLRIIVRHILPNVISPAIVFAVADVVLCILLGGALGFLGLGARPPTPEWGVMIADGRRFITTAWWLATFPGVAIVIVGVAFSLFGDGLADMLRPGGK
jgi:peptide/nickel transport system permease protein